MTLNVGAVLSLASITQYQTQFRDSVASNGSEWIVGGPLNYITASTAPMRFEPYVSPGFLIGIGNFTVGYRHWIYLKDLDIKPGQSGRLWGSLRIGYRFLW